MWTRALIANRGEIARRVTRSARRLGLEVVVVYHDDDAEAPFVAEADLAYPLGGGSLADTYLNISKLIDVARDSGAQLVHPGYGFLSERADFARACQSAGLTFVGPSAELIELMGDKASAKRVAKESGFPCAPGYDGPDQSLARLVAEGEALGAPLMVKATHGGGGRGMRLVTDLSELQSALESASREAESAFGEGAVLIERALLEARHVEVQIFGDSQGTVVHLGERDCSVQRRRQKVIEESPCTQLSESQRRSLCEGARRLAEAVGYVGAGTVECLLTPSGEHYFCEMNTRIQVEHPITELRYGVDLVAWQLKVAMGEPLPLSQEALDERVKSGGYPQHAIEARLYAEDPVAGYLPQAGPVMCWRPPSGEGVRVDDGVGAQVSARFDPMLAKIIGVGDSREVAHRRLLTALRSLAVFGPQTNLAHLIQLLDSEPFIEGRLHTKSLDEARLEGPLAPRLLTPAPPLDRALAAIFLSLPSLSVQAHGDDVSPCLLDGWGTAQRARWEVRLAERLSAGREDVYSVQVRQGGYSSAWVSCEGVERVFSELHFDPERAQLTYRVDQGPLTRVSAWRSTQVAEVSLLSEAGETRRWRDLSYERVSARMSEEDARQVLAPISGVISSVCCEEGEQVNPDKTLITLEAMKLEHALFSPRHATITELHVRAGDLVTAGQLLIKLSAPEPS